MGKTPGTLVKLGYEARREGRLNEGKQLFSEAVELCQGSTQQAMLANSLVGLGQIERDFQNIDSALEHYREAAAIYRTLADPLKLAHTVRHIGDILRGNGSIDQARPHYEESLRIYRQHGETSDLDLANAIRGFALMREEAGETEEAKSLWQEAKTLYERAGVQAGVKESEVHLRGL